MRIQKILILWVLFLSTGAFGECLSVPELTRQNAAAVNALLAKIGQPLRERNSGSQAFDAPEEVVISGVPSFVKVVTAGELPVLRHYTRPEYLTSIREVGGLIAGPTPYVIKGGGYKKTFEDLTGVFFTTPDFKPDQVGLGREIKYTALDFKLPSELKLLYLEPGFYLIPGPGKLPAWIQEAYLKWKSTGEKPKLKLLLETFKRIDAQGGLHKPLCVPITVQN